MKTIQVRRLEVYPPARSFNHTIQILFEKARRRGITQQMMADAIGSTQSSISRLKHCHPALGVDKLMKLLRYLEVEESEKHAFWRAYALDVMARSEERDLFDAIIPDLNGGAVDSVLLEVARARVRARNSKPDF